MLITLPHFAMRAAQRNLSENDLLFVRSHGRKYHARGAVFYFLRRKDIPAGDTEHLRLEGTAILVDSRAPTNEITVWRNRKAGLKVIKRKSKNRVWRD